MQNTQNDKAVEHSVHLAVVYDDFYDIFIRRMYNNSHEGSSIS